MNSTSARPPRVFISYSHDSPEHKRWVLEFATKLREQGVDAVIDAWELRSGDDIPKFMERGVRDADRVLMICSERYVAKVNEGIGGVGYEAMIVTGELVRNLGTAKFIPIIRQKQEKPELPTCVSTRNYVDLSEGRDFNEAIKQLVHDLHEILPEKPPLGPPPNRRAPFPDTVPATTPDADSLDDPSRTFDLALELAQKSDAIRWRRLVARARADISPKLQQWFQQYGTARPGLVDQVIEETMQGIAAFSPLTAIALAGVASGNPKFENQFALLEDILNPTEWQWGGFVVRVELPATGAFAYQALHGALALHLDKLPIALKLARTEVESLKSPTLLPLWQRHDIVAWPESLTKNARKTWEIALGLASRWPWVAHIFGDEAEYQAALYAYYAALSVLEYIELLANHGPLSSEGDFWGLDIPQVFETAPADIKRRGYRLLVSGGSEMRNIASGFKIPDDLVRDNWAKWLKVHAQRTQAEHPFGFQTQKSYYARLIPEIFAA